MTVTDMTKTMISEWIEHEWRSGGVNEWRIHPHRYPHRHPYPYAYYDMNNPWLMDRIRDVEQSIDIIKRDVATLEYLQIGWRPPDGGWSIAQVMEHLILTEERYCSFADIRLPNAM